MTYGIRTDDGRHVDFKDAYPQWDIVPRATGGIVEYTNGPLKGQHVSPNDRIVLNNGKLQAVMPPHLPSCSVR